jgi:hypothetical protein
MEEELKKMHHKCKSLEEKNSMLIGKLAALNESIESRINDDVTIESNSPESDADIPTSNSLHGRRSPKSGKPGKYRLLGLAV